MKIKAASRITRFALLLVSGLIGAPVFAQQKQAPIQGDILIRQEWTEDFFTTPDPVPSSRTRFQIRPRFEIETNSIRMIVGADVNYSTDNNLEPDGIVPPLKLIRDNYDSRNIRLDLASLGINPSPAMKLDVGRMVMPFQLTNMIWDSDLRIQGGSLQWTLVQGKNAEPTARLSGIYSRGSHVFADSKDPSGSSLGDGVSIAGGSLDLGFGSAKRFDFSGTYMQFDNLAYLETMIRRQNTRVNGLLTRAYGVMDVVLRYSTNAPFPIQVIVDGAHNHNAPDQSYGFWTTAVLGSFKDTRFRGEYTFAKVDKDVTVAAYAGDDFFWGTGWLGHRGDIAFAQSPKATFHVIGTMQRFKDSPNPLEQEHWVKRLRLEVRKTF